MTACYWDTDLAGYWRRRADFLCVHVCMQTRKLNRAPPNPFPTPMYRVGQINSNSWILHTIRVVTYAPLYVMTHNNIIHVRVSIFTVLCVHENNAKMSLPICRPTSVRVLHWEIFRWWSQGFTHSHRTWRIVKKVWSGLYSPDSEDLHFQSKWVVWHIYVEYTTWLSFIPCKHVNNCVLLPFPCLFLSFPRTLSHSLFFSYSWTTGVWVLITTEWWECCHWLFL